MHNGDEPPTHYYDSTIDSKVDRALDHLAAEDDQTYNECMQQNQIVVATAAIWTQRRMESLMAFERDVLLPYVNSFKHLLFKQPYHTCPFRGIDWVNDLLHPDSHPGRIYRALGVHYHVFMQLLDVLRHLGYSDSKHVTLEEQLAIFLHGCVKGIPIVDLGERFQRSNETISKYFRVMLRAFSSAPFYSEYVTLPSCTAPVPPEIAGNPKFFPYFEDVLGALDGTHLHCRPLQADRDNCRNRKGFLSTNCLAVCSFDMRFLYVLNGWEGSASDATVFNDARQHDFRIPPGRQYLADAGYFSCAELLIPYRGVRYHLAEWARGDLRPRNKEELYNLRHASARNVVERIFGVNKMRFKILKDPIGFAMETQIEIIYALAALHNFIRRHDPEEIELLLKDPRLQEEIDASSQGDLSVQVPTRADRREAMARRDEIAQHMWDDYVVELERRGLGVEGQ